MHEDMLIHISFKRVHYRYLKKGNTKQGIFKVTSVWLRIHIIWGAKFCSALLP